MVPIPYPVYGLAGDDGNYSPNVFYNGLAAKKFDSVITTTIGDAPGIALGVKSGTVESIVEPTGHSTVLRINGQWAIRHRDSCTLNNGNCPGEYIFVGDTAPRKPPDGNNRSEKDAASASGGQDGRGAGERFADGFSDSAGETWEGMKTVAGDTWEGAKSIASNLWNDPSGTIASGASSTWGKATGAAAWTGDVAGNLATDPWGTVGRGVDNTLSTGSAIWHGIADPYADAYAKGGLAQAAGHGTFDVVKLAAEALATKGALTAAGKAGTVLAGAAKAADKVDDVADAAEAAKKAEDLDGKTKSGNPGARVTRGKFEVPCFDKKGKWKKDPKLAKEYDRQLDMQENALNRMAPKEYLDARAAFDPSNRLPAVQQQVRNDWLAGRIDELAYEGLSRAAAATQAAQEAGALAALHELDMIAGGSAENVVGMGNKRVNSAIGSSWKSRVEKLDEEANRALEAGEKTLDVKLKRC